MNYRIEIRDKKGIYDAIGEGVKKDILELGYAGVTDVNFIQVYLIDGDVSPKNIVRMAKDLFTDPVTQEFACPAFKINESGKIHIVEIAYNPGVMDPVEESALKAARDLGIDGINMIRTAKKYVIKGRFSKNELSSISDKLLYNKVIQHAVKGKSEIHKSIAGYEFKLTTVDILGAGDDRLAEISKKGQLYLSIEEMRTIKKYFRKIGRNPTDCELESIAQTWSEHCKHKTFRGTVRYNGKVIKNLLKSTVMKATRELNKEWCVSVFTDNSGVIRFDEKNDVCFKVETHNHPSAIEPYGGAGTGIGGVIRDPLGTGLGAKPIMNTDVFCFAPPDMPMSKIPKGVLHPKRVMKGVVSGVRDYGNRMGIPTCNGAILFDERFLGNPLVYCGNVGIMPRNMTEKRVDKGDMIIVIGGRTGRDGIHGATFSSSELTEESESISGQAVQIGNAITEKKVADTIIKARDLRLYKAITDCGAGGLSSAVGELTEETGAEVYLEKVPLKYSGLSYTEIWISEAQERMVVIASKEKTQELLSVFADENVEATVIGKVTDSKRLELFYDGNKVADLEMDFLHNGVPDLKRKAVWKKPRLSEPVIKAPKDLTLSLLEILSSWNVASKEWVIRQYDHEVQAGSVLKPLQGPNCDGPGDAAVIMPVLGSKKGLAISNGINFLYGFIDPYWMAASSIDEALRQIVAVGGDPEKIAVLDNFCWGNTDRPETLGSLVRASLACYDIAKAYGVPFISGKDSLNNEFKSNNKLISIPGTLLISAIGIVDNVEKTISMDFKCPGNYIYAIGNTYNELGGSHYYKINGKLGANAPKVNAKKAFRYYNKLHKAILSGAVSACHDCSEGGIGVAVSEMCFAGDIGAIISLKNIPTEENIKRNDILLFSESNSRFIAEVPRGKKEVFEKIMKNEPVKLIGQTKNSKLLCIEGRTGEIAAEASISRLKDACQKPFKKW